MTPSFSASWLLAVVALLALIAAGCSQVATEQANLPAEPQAELELETPRESPTAADPTSEADSPDSPTDDRGSRVGADEEFQAIPTSPATPVPTPIATTAPVPTVESAPAESTSIEQAETDELDDAGETDDAGEEQLVPSATAVATTAPVSPPTPVSPPAQAPAPTATAVPVITQDPEPVFIAPTPTGPVPSDEIVVQGPVIDESEAVAISVNGAAACARAESAIDLLDRGDTQRTATALLEASQFAAGASESEIVAVASQLANAGADEGAAVAAIIATLNACALHGYQV